MTPKWWRRDWRWSNAAGRTIGGGFGRFLRGLCGGRLPPPPRDDLIDVQRAQARRRTLHHGCVDLGDLDVERGDPTADSGFVGELIDRGEHRLHRSEQLQRWRQRIDLL